MRIISFIRQGFARSLKAWKGILIIWVFNLILVSLLAIPFKAGLNSVLQHSMITGLLAEGINIDVIVDLGSNLKVITSSIFSGLFIATLAGYIMNIFLTGGLFTILGKQGNKNFSSSFFSGCASNFWSFLVVTLILLLVILLLGVIIIAVPLIIVMSSGSGSEKTPYITGKVAILVFTLILPLWLLVADYARSWLASSEKKACFRAIGEGFRQTFRFIISSYPVMFLLMIIQLLFTFFVFRTIPGMTPETGAMVLLLFLASQGLFILRLFLRAWRYGSIVAMFEDHPHA